MIRIVRHISVRFWLATLMVLPSAFILFPRFSGWLSDMPASVFIFLMYVVCGIGLGLFMDIAGLWRIRRLVRDAQLWERSGIATRAEKKFIRAVRIYDSAWISPLAARRAGPMLTSSMARFYLASGSRRKEIQGAASAWLARNPKDKSLARFWLERIKEQDVSGTFTQSILTVLADTWYADSDLCRALVGVFLDQGRMDFSARRLYRSFLEMTDNDKEVSDQDSILAATIRNMMSARLDTPEPEPDLEREPDLESPGSGTLGDERVDLAAFSVDEQRGGLAPENGPAGWRPEENDCARKEDSEDSSTRIAGIGRTTVREKWGRRGRTFMVACLSVWLILFVCDTLYHMFKKTADQPAQQIKIVMPKPYTIQVAAYRKKVHAEKYMALLSQKGVKTSMKTTDGGGRTWYLVRASEFPDQKSAQDYGNHLKADHIIDEFFVIKK